HGQALAGRLCAQGMPARPRALPRFARGNSAARTVHPKTRRQERRTGQEMTRKKYIWLAVALVVALIALGVIRALSARKAQQDAIGQSAAKVQAVVELAASDVFKAGTRDIEQGLPISGSLKAVNTATVKARVAGELQGLSVREGDVVKAGQVLA